jgi:hypothetical protein
VARYSYVFRNLLTNAAIAELPLTNVSFSEALNGVGELSAELALGDPRVLQAKPVAATEPAQTALWVDRDGVPVWAGVVWKRGYDSTARTLRLGCADLFSYFRRRFIKSTLTYAATDQLAIARGIMNYAQAVTSGSIGVVVGTETSGVLRDRTYFAHEAKNVGRAIEQLSAVDNGFDFSIRLSYTGGVPQAWFALHYPKRGRAAVLSGHVWEYGPNTRGNILAYTWPEDGGLAANEILGFGAGEGDLMVRGAALEASVLGTYPLLQDTVSLKDIKDINTLMDHLRAIRDARAVPVVLPKLTVRADSDPQFGAWTVGDDANIRITDVDRFPRQADGTAGLDTFRRIVGYRLQVPDGGGVETVDLTLDLPQGA